VPHLFVATDAMSVNYLCVLYNHSDGYDYIGVQVSELRLRNFLAGIIDLRLMFTDAEMDNCIYHVVVKDECISADRLMQSSEISDDMLPDAGYYFDAEDADLDNNLETLEIKLPARDCGFFADMARRMGWNAKTINQAFRKIAVL